MPGRQGALGESSGPPKKRSNPIPHRKGGGRCRLAGLPHESLTGASVKRACLIFPCQLKLHRLIGWWNSWRSSAAPRGFWSVVAACRGEAQRRPDAPVLRSSTAEGGQRRHRFGTPTHAVKAAWRFASRRSPKSLLLHGCEVKTVYGTNFSAVIVKSAVTASLSFPKASTSSLVRVRPGVAGSGTWISPAPLSVTLNRTNIWLRNCGST